MSSHAGRALAVALALVSGGCSCPGWQSPNTTSSPAPQDGAAGDSAEDLALVVTWLGRDCSLGEEPLEAALVGHGEALEPLLVQAFANGPDATERAAVATFTARACAKGQALRVDLRPGPLPPGDARDNGRYRAEQVLRDLDLVYRARAARGIGIVGGAKGRAALAAALPGANPPLATAIRQAIATIDARVVR